MRVVCSNSSGSDLLNQNLPQFTMTTLRASRSEGSVGGSDRAKHIHLREHFVHEVVEKKILKLEAIKSTGKAADLPTKPLLKGKVVKSGHSASASWASRPRAIDS